MNAVKHEGRYVVYDCNGCSTLLTSLHEPGPDDRWCVSCRPVPLDAPSGQLEAGAPAMAELLTRRALKDVEAKDWLQAECRLVNALAYVRTAGSAARRQG